DQLQQGALAGTGMPGDEQHLALVHAKADVDQGLVPTRILLADVLESEDGHGRDYAGPRTRARPPCGASENRRPTTTYPRTWQPRPGIRDATLARARAGAWISRRPANAACGRCGPAATAPWPRPAPDRAPTAPTGGLPARPRDWPAHRRPGPRPRRPACPCG